MKGLCGLIRKKDMLIVGLALLVAAGALVFASVSGGKDGADTVCVYVDGTLYAKKPLAQDGEIRVEQEDGSVNVIVIRDGSVHMDYSSCENQLCVQQGSVSAKNRFFLSLCSQIVCLPNRVMIELEVGGNLPQGDLPDV